MKKHKKVKCMGVKLYVPIEKKHNRPSMPRPAVYADRKKYDRRRQKTLLREEIADK